MAQIGSIKFSDLCERDKQATAKLKQQLAYLENLKERRNGNLPPDEENELERVASLLQAKEKEILDPLFVGVRSLFNSKPELLGNGGKKLKSLRASGELDFEGKEKAFDEVAKVSLVLGLLADDGVEDVELVMTGGVIGVNPHKPSFGRLKRSFYAALGEMEDDWELAKKLLCVLQDVGKPNGEEAGTVNCLEFAQVIRMLKEQGVRDGEPKLRRRVEQCLDKIQFVGSDDPTSDIALEVQDLNATVDFQFQGNNIRLMGSMICSAMLEDLKFFQVVDKISEMAQNLTLPIGQGEAGKTLYRYWRDASTRMTEPERRSFYAMTIGIPGGDSNGNVNREFNDLWIRFVSSVSSLVRQKTVDTLLRQGIPAAIGQQQVRKAARDLALNLSAHGYGMAYYVAAELRGEINKIIKLLSDKEIMSAFGARDMWQVIDQVATLELGGARTSARYRTLANCGVIITAWLANNVNRYNQTSMVAMIDMDAVTASYPISSPTPTTTPTDYDLVNACELWLADTATPDLRIEELAQPREAPMMTSRPVPIPAIAREMLEQAGVAGFGMGKGY